MVKFITAVEALLAEEMFEVESDYTSAALKTAVAVREWARQAANRDQLCSFAHVLIVRLNACFPCKHSTIQLRKERMWGAYHRFRTSNTFVRDWQAFLSTSVQLKAFPAFYQFVTHHLFKDLIKMHYPVVEKIDDQQESPARPLTHEEKTHCAMWLDMLFAHYVID